MLSQGPAAILQVGLTTLYALVVQSLWYMPLFGWLLLASAWAKRGPLWWAVLPPVALILVENLAFGTRVVPIEDTMAAMSELKEKGKIRSIGVSNFSFAQLKEANQYADIDSIQSPYSLFWRHIGKDIMSYCQKDNISILAYSPMAQGLLTGKFHENPDVIKNRPGPRKWQAAFKEKGLKKTKPLPPAC